MRLLVACVAGVLIQSSVHGEDFWKVRPGQVIIYEGTIKFQQSSDDGAPDVVSFQPKLLLSTREDSPGKVNLLAIRILKPSGDEPEDVWVAFNDGKLESSPGGFRLVPVDEPASELEEMAQKLDLYFPLEPLPAFPLPAPGTETKWRKSSR